MAVNKIILVGNVGQDPEVVTTNNGNSIAKFSLATTEKWKNANGEQQEKTNWHRCVVFGKRADVIAQYVKKGSQLYIEGSMEYGSYEKDGVTMYTADVHVKDFQFIGGKRDDAGQGGQQGGWGQPQQQDQNQRQGRTYPYGGWVPEQSQTTATLKPEGQPKQRQMSQAERMLAEQSAKAAQANTLPPDFDDDIPF